MGFWNKLGKIALQVAPYVAAPFTGGASLAFAPASRQLGQKWAEHDARANMEKGLGPSRFDQILGSASEIGGMASDMGAFGKFGAGKYRDNGGFNERFDRNAMGGGGGYSDRGGFGIDESGGFGGSRGGWRDMLSQVLNRGFGGGSQGQGQGGYSYGRGQEQAVSRNGGQMGVSRFGRRMQRQLGPVMGAEDQSNPNLAYSIGAGRMDAMRNQPFRGGYDMITGYEPEPADDSQGNEGAPIYSSMPPIYPTGQRRNRQQVYQ